MPEEIVYCDQCSRMIPAADVRSGEAVVASDCALCAACAGELSPERRAALERLAGGGADDGSPSRLTPVPPGRTPEWGEPAPKRRAPATPSPRTAQRRKPVHATALRTSAKQSRAGPKSVAMMIAGVGAALIAGALILMLGSSGPPGRQKKARRRSSGTSTERSGEGSGRAEGEAPVVISPVTGRPLRSPGSAPVPPSRPGYRPGLTRREGSTAPRRPPAEEAPPDLGRGLVAYWKLDEAGGSTVADSSGNDISGTLVNMAGTEWVNGKVGGALAVDGVDDYVRFGNPAAVANVEEYTLAAWVRPDDASTDQTFGDPVVAKETGGDGFQLTWRCTDGAGRFGLMTESVARMLWSAGDKTNGSWYHVAGIYDRKMGEARIYVDGVLENSGGRTYVRNTTDLLTIGSFNGTQRFLRATVDDVRIYERALTPVEVDMLHRHAVPAGAETGAPVAAPWDLTRALVGHWKFDETAATTAADASSHGNDGALKGNVSFVPSGKVRGAFHFDGVAGCVEVPGSGSLDLPAALTVAFWLRRSPSAPAFRRAGAASASQAGDFKVIERPRQFSVGVNQGGAVRFGYAHASGGAYGRWFDGRVEIGRWTHVVLTRDEAGTEVRLYVDGALVERGVASGIARTQKEMGPSARPVIVGKGFPGDVDDVRVYSRALGEAEIKAIYQLDKP